MSSPYASSSSPALYVPVHRRTPSSSGSLTPASSPASSSRALSPSPPPFTPGIYTPAQLLALSGSPLSVGQGTSMVDALRAVAPEVVQTRKQRKAIAWRARHPTPKPTPTPSHTPGHKRTSSHRSSQSHSESEEEKTVSWRRV